MKKRKLPSEILKLRILFYTSVAPAASIPCSGVLMNYYEISGSVRIFIMAPIIVLLLLLAFLITKQTRICYRKYGDNYSFFFPGDNELPPQDVINDGLMTGSCNDSNGDCGDGGSNIL